MPPRDPGLGQGRGEGRMTLLGHIYVLAALGLFLGALITSLAR
jgi:hypothetical protein